MAIPFTAKLRVADKTLARNLKGESVVLSLEQQSYFGLDETGTRMWAVLVEAPSIQAAYEQLLEEYDVDSSQLRTDLANLVEQLTDKGLLRVEEA